MGKIVAIAVIGFAVWLTYSENAQQNFKNNMLNFMGQEKTIKKVNLRMNESQKEINEALER